QIGAPPAVDAEAGHAKVASGELEVEFPAMHRGRFYHVLLVEPGLAHVELRYRGRGACPAELEAALVELEVARGRSAVGIRLELQRTGHPRRDVVAVEQQRLIGGEREVEQGLATGEGHCAIAGDTSAAAGLTADLAEDQLRPGEVGLRRQPADDHAGDRTFEPRVLRL